MRFLFPVTVLAWLFVLFNYGLRFKKIMLISFMVITPLFLLLWISGIYVLLGWQIGIVTLVILKSAQKRKIALEGIAEKRTAIYNYYLTLAVILSLSSALVSIINFTAISTNNSILKFITSDRFNFYVEMFCIILIALSLALFISISNRTFIEDMNQIAIVDTSEKSQTFVKAFLRYLLMIATFPLIFGLINFAFKEPLYNKWTGAIEYKNSMRTIKNGWLYRTIAGGSQKADSTRTS